MTDTTERDDAPEITTNYIREIVADDVASGRTQSVVTRFPPEPNGHLHLGHAKSICLNFGLAEVFGGQCHLRFDDTNPTKEEQAFIDAIEADVRWLGFDWGAHVYHASDYFEQLYDWAVHLIKVGKAYVDDLSADEMREWRGTLTEPGRNSPHRDRPVDENVDLFARMRAGVFADGAHPSAYRRYLVHLSHLRFYPRPIRRNRRGDPFGLYVGIRRPSAALRLVYR
jgi:glutaminyl-tRNA synthetase